MLKLPILVEGNDMFDERFLLTALTVIYATQVSESLSKVATIMRSQPKDR